MAMQFTYEEVQNADTGKDYSQGAVLPAGWNKIALIKEDETKESKTGTLVGGNFHFFNEESGVTIQMWFATEAIDVAKSWCVKRTQALMVKIAKTLGIANFTSTEQLYNRPFYANLRVGRRDYMKNGGTDSETGEIKTEKVTSFYNEFVGAPDDSIKSVAEYRSEQTQRNDDRQTRVIRKAAEIGDETPF